MTPDVGTDRIALSFDDGPGAGTDAILDVLAANDARATFFVIGSVVRHREETLRRIAAEGHEIGNHSWSHPWLARDCDDSRVRKELERTNGVLESVLGTAPRRFRAPRYDVDERVIRVAADLGLAHTHGDIRPPDWDARCSSAYIVTFVLQQARDGVIVGLHDGVPPNRLPEESGREQTIRAVEILVPRLRARGFELVTVEELEATIAPG
jgi:peptidoglycan/xylan/chitin deacetylase (PgdA/CDA1 family)